MRDLPQRERAQLGLQYIEDAVVNVLANHADGMSSSRVADVLGLRLDLDSNRREMIADGVLALLHAAGRITWDNARQVYLGKAARP